MRTRSRPSGLGSWRDTRGRPSPSPPWDRRDSLRFMRITPLDIIQKQFTPSRRGYDSDEVRGFLDAVRESLEELLKENQRLKDLIAQRDREIAELRDNESD